MTPRPTDLSGFVGRQIPGGCEMCHAYQSVTEEADNVWSLIVHHDDWCPVLRVRKAGAN